LLNAGWQIALIAVVAALCDRLLRGTAARYRHKLWVAALAISLCLPALTSSGLSVGAFFSREAQSQTTAQLAIGASVPSPQLIPPDTPLQRKTHQKETNSFILVNRNVAAVLVVLYLLFLCYHGFKLLSAWKRTKAITRSAYQIEPLERVQTIIEKCQTALGVARVRIMCSNSVSMPVTVGTINPLILVPEQLLREGEPQVLTSAIGHEMVHVLRRDYFLNLIYELIYLPLSFHPAAALLRRRIRESRELSCDELVTERLLEAEIYARSLVQLAGAAVASDRPTTIITVGITDADILEERIMKLLSRPKRNVRGKNLLLITAAVLFAVPCVAAAPFALRIGINPLDAVVTPQQNANQEKRGAQKREDVKVKVSYKLTQKKAAPKREIVIGDKGEEIVLIPKIIAIRKLEREMRAKDQAELAKQARITMQQAIQVATNQQPGTVMECRLGREEGEVVYKLLILSGDDKESIATYFLISAIDGRVVKFEKEKR
ncbi:MAG: hypothetical protein L0220_27830, partial [Acidobacteria bacterium]|nr:hypothetical protein [Acidobacteriota bacterium]